MVQSVDVCKCILVKDKTIEYGKHTMSDMDAVIKICRKIGLHVAAEEYFYALGLDVKGKITTLFEISHGDLSQAVVHPREVFKRLICASAAGVILIHNHPSGSPEPSEGDIATTRRMKECGDILGIDVLDHVIIADDSHFSFQEYGSGLISTQQSEAEIIADEYPESHAL